MKRRDFLKLTSSCGSVVAFSSLCMPLSLFAQENSSRDDYKALVIILQLGGNDALNMFVPSGDDSRKGYSNYASIRTSLAVNNVDLNSQLTQVNGKLKLSTNPYASTDGDIELSYKKGFYKHPNIDGLATNGIMPEFAHLVNQGKVAIVANSGNIIKPTTREEILSNKAELPLYLGSHNSQRRMMFTGQASNLSTIGWAGRLADKWKGINNNAVYGLNISLNGLTHLMYGNKTTPLILDENGPKTYSAIDIDAYSQWLELNDPDKYHQLYKNKQKHSLLMQNVVGDDWNNLAPTFTTKNAYGLDLFTIPTNEVLDLGHSIDISSTLSNKLKAVAKLAYIGKQKGLKRQIFYVSHRNYDTHSNQNKSHPILLREFSLALGDFQLAIEEMGMDKNITTFNVSDFGRSVGNNGDGTDHAWGSHHFVMGGAVKPGIYGTLPDLTLGGEDDSSKKGRLIPTTSMAQYFGTIVKWFGADEDTLNELFPDRVNFTQKDLGFMG